MQKKKKSTKHMGPKPQYTRKEIKGPRIIAAKYNTSCVKADQYPEGDTVEVAFLGRSNVGKSSLINSLCNYRGLALVSGQPGKTKTINYFDIESKEDLSETEERRYHWFLVDLPGYGFAKTNKDNRNMWSSFISDYILHSERLMLSYKLNLTMASSEIVFIILVALTLLLGTLKNIRNIYRENRLIEERNLK